MLEGVDGAVESWWRWLLLLSKLNLGLVLAATVADSVSFFGALLFCCFSSSLPAWPAAVPAPAIPVPLLFLLLALTDCRSSKQPLPPLGPLLLSLFIASLSSFIFQSASFCGRNREKRSADLPALLLWFWPLLLLLLLLFVAKFNACGKSGEWKLNAAPAAAEDEDVEGGRGKNGDGDGWW